MEKRMTVTDYFATPETNTRQELVYGFVREPDAPSWGHQEIVARLLFVLERFVQRRRLGVVCGLPVDVVLDRRRALVLQPDLIFISAKRLDIIRERVWGPPDLVVEVLSRRTATRDRTRKLEWYRKYGVKEYWLIDPWERAVTVVALQRVRDASKPGRVYRGRERLYSRTLPGFRPSVARLVPASSSARRSPVAGRGYVHGRRQERSGEQRTSS